MPHVTIDMGDGRRLEGTITGNSIHYVLDGQGRVVDALPGLYAPRLFLRLLGGSEAMAREASALEGAAWVARVTTSPSCTGSCMPGWGRPVRRCRWRS